MAKHFKAEVEEIDSYIKKHLSKSRYEHSVSVANYAKYLAHVYGKTNKTARLAYFAGLAHDICKELSDDKQLKLLEKSGGKITAIEKQRINLLHGTTAAYVLATKFKVKNRDILQAVQFHTFGTPKLCTIGKLIFVADKIEPGREDETAAAFRKVVGKISFNELTLKVVQESMRHTLGKGLEISPHTLAMEKALLLKMAPHLPEAEENHHV